MNKLKTLKTDWGQVAGWYDNLIQDTESYQVKVILPNLLRILGEAEKIKDKKILDLACGTGFFSNILAKMGAEVIGLDLGNDLIKIAKENTEKKNTQPFPKYFVASAENFAPLLMGGADRAASGVGFDFVICVLAIQNIKKVDLVLQEIKKVLKLNGKIIFIINHPCFRIAKYSDWVFNENKDLSETFQARSVSKYMSEITLNIDMNPSQKNINSKKFTVSFHRPLQFYAKLFAKNNLVISKIEEWISHKTSEEKAKRKIQEDLSRKEIPMFMMLEVENKK